MATIATTAPQRTHPPAIRTARPGLWIASWSLWQREIVRFYRQRARVIGGVDPFGGPDLSCPIEAVDTIRWHTVAPPAETCFYHRNYIEFNLIRRHDNSGSQQQLNW